MLAKRTRDRLIDGATLLLTLAVGLLATSGTDLPSGLLEANVAIGVVACVATVGLRRRWPLALMVVTTVIATPFPLAGGASLAALFFVAVHLPVRTSVSAGGFSFASGIVLFALYPSSDLTFWTSMGFNAGIVAAVVGWGAAVRSRREVLFSLTERVQRAEAEQQLRVERARHGERERIAREMHDVLAHRLSLLSLHAGALEFRHDATREEIALAAGVIRDNAHQGLEELRAVIGELRDDAEAAAPEPPQPTLADVPGLVAESRQAGTPVRERCALEDLTTVPPSVGRHAYRIVQEGLTNARKHAPRCEVELVLDGRPGGALVVELRNRLPSTGAVATSSAIPGAAIGLVGLAERVALAGGRLTHGRQPDGRYGLCAELPWPT